MFVKITYLFQWSLPTCWGREWRVPLLPPSALATQPQSNAQSQIHSISIAKAVTEDNLMSSARVVCDRMERWCFCITRVSQRKLTGVWGVGSLVSVSLHPHTSPLAQSTQSESFTVTIHNNDSCNTGVCIETGWLSVKEKGTCHMDWFN